MTKIFEANQTVNSTNPPVSTHVLDWSQVTSCYAGYEKYGVTTCSECPAKCVCHKSPRCKEAYR
jgi:hypothetical protein